MKCSSEFLPLQIPCLRLSSPWKDMAWLPGTVSTTLPFTHLVSPVDATMTSRGKYQTGKIRRQAHPQCNLRGNIRSGRGERTQKRAITQVRSRSYLSEATEDKLSASHSGVSCVRMGIIISALYAHKLATWCRV